MLLVQDTVAALQRAIQDNQLPLTIGVDGAIKSNGTVVLPTRPWCRQRILQIAAGPRVTAYCLLEPFTDLALAACSTCQKRS